VARDTSDDRTALVTEPHIVVVFIPMTRTTAFACRYKNKPCLIDLRVCHRDGSRSPLRTQGRIKLSLGRQLGVVGVNRCSYRAECIDTKVRVCDNLLPVGYIALGILLYFSELAPLCFGVGNCQSNHLGASGT
jgi:hypothetical protein